MERWPNRPTAQADLLFLLSEASALGDFRNNAVHAPVLLHIGGGKGGSTIMGPSMFPGHPRALRLATKGDLIEEFQWVEKWTDGLTSFGRQMWSALVACKQSMARKTEAASFGSREKSAEVGTSNLAQNDIRARLYHFGSDFDLGNVAQLGSNAMATLEERGVRAIGIAWIRKEDYAALIRIFEDGDVFDDWENWSKRAEATEQKLQSEGVIVLRAYLDPATFAAWCAARDVNTGREGRGLFGIEFAEERYGRDQS